MKEEKVQEDLECSSRTCKSLRSRGRGSFSKLGRKELGGGTGAQKCRGKKSLESSERWRDVKGKGKLGNWD